MKPVIWGNVRGEGMYLPQEFIEHCSIHWNLSDIEGCEQVMVQISREYGFQDPSSGNVMEESELSYHYWGPPRTTCGALEIEGPLPPPAISAMSNNNINLFRNYRGDIPNTTVDRKDIIRHIRLVPCNANREQIADASGSVIIHCVNWPSMRLFNVNVEIDWMNGQNWKRIYTFTIEFNSPYPHVSHPPTQTVIPSTLLIFTPSTFLCPYHEIMLDNLSLKIDDQYIHMQNKIRHPFFSTQQRHAYVIRQENWRIGHLYQCKLEQRFPGGGALSVWDFFTPAITTLLVPGIDPAWIYCGGYSSGELSHIYGFDSLNGRGDLRNEDTLTPYHSIAIDGTSIPENACCHWCDQTTCVEEINSLLERVFEGTRTVTFQTFGVIEEEELIEQLPVRWEAGEKRVIIRFHTELTDPARYLIDRTTHPIHMFERRGRENHDWIVEKLTTNLRMRQSDWLSYPFFTCVQGNLNIYPEKLRISVSQKLRPSYVGLEPNPCVNIRYRLRARP
jgi:hypothetical protein